MLQRNSKIKNIDSNTFQQINSSLLFQNCQRIYIKIQLSQLRQYQEPKMRKFSLTEKNLQINQKPSSYNTFNNLSKYSTTKINLKHQDDKFYHNQINKHSLSRQKSITKSISKNNNHSINKLMTSKSKKSLSRLNSTQKIPKKILFSQQLQNLQIQCKQLLSKINKFINHENSFLAKHVKIRINQWLKILQCNMHNQVWSQNRNLYLKVLLTMLENQLILQPFSNVPPEGPLPKLNIGDIPFLIKQKMVKKYNIIRNQKSNSKGKTISVKKRDSLGSTSITDIQMLNSISKSRLKYNKNFTQKMNLNSIDKFKQEEENKQNNFFYSNIQSRQKSIQRDRNKRSKKSCIKKLQSITFQNQLSDIQFQQDSFPDYLFTFQNGQHNHNQSQFQLKESQIKSISKSKISKYSSIQKFSNHKKSMIQSKKSLFQKKGNISQTQTLVLNNNKDANQLVNINYQIEYSKGYNILLNLKKYLRQKQKVLGKNNQFYLIFNRIDKKISQMQKNMSEIQNKSGKTINISSNRRKTNQNIDKFESISCNLKQKISKTGEETMKFLNFLGKYNSNP